MCSGSTFRACTARVSAEGGFGAGGRGGGAGFCAAAGGGEVVRGVWRTTGAFRVGAGFTVGFTVGVAFGVAFGVGVGVGVRAGDGVGVGVGDGGVVAGADDVGVQGAGRDS
ncbi:hypothetical protein [Streptomyces sp. NPDC015131]|uniref:hypothetical protein n=1 Tax=Streptomyces sp. NPDC015131 TaxID=3364941 RepID=UPI0036F64800